MKYEMVTLDELVSIKGGGTPSKDKAEYWNGNIPWASVKDLTSLWLSSTIDHISEEGLRNSSANLIKAGTIIIPTRMALGKVSINTIDVAINQDLKALSIKNNKTTSINYLKYFLISKADEIEKNGKGATVKGITIDVIKNLRIPLPPLPEQTRIAAILDQADKIRQKRRRAAALADEFLRSVFLEMFGDPVSNPKGWEVRTLGELTVSKPSYGASASAIDYDGEHRYIRITDILDNGDLSIDSKSADISIDEIPKYTLEDGDLLFARSGATVGKTFLYKKHIGKSLYAGYLIRFQFDKQKVMPEYVFYFTKTNAYKTWINSHMKTVAQPNINAQQYSELTITLPPLEVQRNFLSIMNQVNKLREQHFIAIKNDSILFQSLSQQFFNPT